MYRRASALRLYVFIVLLLCGLCPLGAATARAQTPYGTPKPVPSVAPTQAGGVVHLQVNPSLLVLAPGGSSSVTLQAITGGAAVGAWTVDIAYDPTLVRAVACVASAGGATALCNAAQAAGTVRVTGASGAGLSGTMQLALITF